MNPTPSTSSFAHRTFQLAIALLASATMTAGLAYSQPAAGSPDEIGALEASALMGPKQHKKRQKRPMKLGVSGGSTEDFGVFGIDIFCCGGTLGALVEKDGVPYILSNNHVLARINQAATGEAIVQPGLGDTNCEVEGDDVIGTLSGFKKLKLNGKNRTDAAIAAISEGAVSTDGAILGVGVPGNGTVAPTIGTAVIKSGRTTGVTQGEVVAKNIAGLVTFPLTCGDESDVRQIQFVKVFLVASTNNKDFSRGGDSGSVIYEDVENCPRAMGLLFAGNEELTAANPMAKVMKDVKRMKPKGKANLVGCDPLVTSGSLLSTAFDDREERLAMRVQRRTQDDVLSLPGVHAMGIGRAADGPDRLVFKVFVDDSRPEIAGSIPASIEGVPVEMVVTGRLRALHCPDEGSPETVLGGLRTSPSG